MSKSKAGMGVAKDGHFIDLGDRWYSRGDVVQGTEGFVEVVYASPGGGYEWEEFAAWYDTVSRRFFWSWQSGCSCYGFEFESLGELENGDRNALIRTAKEYAENCSFISDAQRSDHKAALVQAITNFNPSKIITKEEI